MSFLPILSRAAAVAVVALALAVPAQAALTETQHQALLRALDDEYHAQATYDAIITKFGAVRPFTNIRQAERVHEALVADALRANGYAVPANPYETGAKPLGRLPATLPEACALGVQAEIANAALYDNDLLPAVRGDAQLTAILTKLRNDSQQRHLPAFQRCGGSGGQMQGGRMGGGGMGGGHGQGRMMWQSY